MLDAAWVTCPYCGEQVEISIDPSAGQEQSYVEDCEVCCRPWRVELRLKPEGQYRVRVFAEEENDALD